MKRLIFYLFIVFSLSQANAQAPTVQWAKSFGSTGFDNVTSIALDVSGNIYTMGNFLGTIDFDPGINIDTLTSNGDVDIYITKIDPTGNLIWARTFGGDSTDFGSSISIDSFGNIYTTGLFYGTADFDPGPSIDSIGSNGSSNLFILKLDTAGNFIWAKSITGNFSQSSSYNSSVDASGNIYMTGNFIGTRDFDPGVGIDTLTSSGYASFIAKYDSYGNLIWAKSIHGSLYYSDICNDFRGNIYLTGNFSSITDFDPDTSSYNLSPIGSSFSNVYILKLDSSGKFIWAKQFINGNYNYYYSIAVDLSGNVYTTGGFGNTTDFDPGPGAFNLTANGSFDIFICKLDSSGNFKWAKQTGGYDPMYPDIGTDIIIDGTGNIIATGYFNGISDFDPGPGVHLLSSHGYSDVYILKLDTNGNYVWATSMGSGGDDHGISVAIDAAGNIYNTGYFFGPAYFGNDTLSSVGSTDVFIQKISQPTVGIKENNFKNEFSIYPNPTNNLVIVAFTNPFQEKNIEVYNSIGELISNKTTSENTTTIDLSKQPDGLYIAKVISGNKIIGEQKIVKE